MACLLLASCSDSPSEPATPVATSITLSSTTLALTYLGATQQLSATILDKKGAPMAGAAVTWDTSVPQVATVSAAGLVSAVGVGSGVITARAGSISATATVTVQQIATSVAVTPATVSLDALGATQQLTATVKDQGGTAVAGAAVTWASSASDVASVSNSGLVTAIKAGSATINAVSGSASSTASVVVQQAASKVRVSPTSSAAQVGETKTFQAQILDARDNPMAGSVVWSSSSTGIAVVDAAGAARGVAPGTATIRATAGSISGDATLVVSDTVRPTASMSYPVDGVTLNEVVTVRADANDNHAVAKLVLLVDGKGVDTLTAKPWEFKWRTRLVANGAHTVQVLAVDPSGNQVTSKAVSVTTSNALVVRVINYLSTRITTDINGSTGSVSSERYHDYSILLAAGATLTFSWEASKPLLSDGTPVGERFAGVFAAWTPVPADSLVEYEVDNVLTESTYYFAMITNKTSAILLPVVNRGTGAEYRCPCSVPAGLERGMIGYYELHSWSNVAVYNWAKGYTGPYTSFTVAAQDLEEYSGDVEFPFTVAPSPPRIAGLEPRRPGGRILVDRFLETPLVTYDEAGVGTAQPPSLNSSTTAPPAGRSSFTGVAPGPKLPSSVRPLSSMR